MHLISVRRNESRNQPKDRGFTTSGWTQNNRSFSFIDFKRDIVQDLFTLIAFGYGIDAHPLHWIAFLFMMPGIIHKIPAGSNVAVIIIMHSAAISCGDPLAMSVKMRTGKVS